MSLPLKLHHFKVILHHFCTSTVRVRIFLDVFVFKSIYRHPVEYCTIAFFLFFFFTVKSMVKMAFVQHLPIRACCQPCPRHGQLSPGPILQDRTHLALPDPISLLQPARPGQPHISTSELDRSIAKTQKNLTYNCTRLQIKAYHLNSKSPEHTHKWAVQCWWL